MKSVILREYYTLACPTREVFGPSRRLCIYLRQNPTILDAYEPFIYCEQTRRFFQKFSVSLTFDEDDDRVKVAVD